MWMIPIEETKFIVENEAILKNICSKYKIKHNELQLNETTSVEEVENFAKLNADILGTSEIRICVLEDDEFEEKCGKSFANYTFNINIQNSECIYLRKSNLKDTEFCFHNIAHEMRHHYQKTYSKEFWDERYDYFMEIDANAYAKLMSFYFGLVWIDTEGVLGESKTYQGKTVMDINRDTGFRIVEIRPQVQCILISIGTK